MLTDNAFRSILEHCAHQAEEGYFIASEQLSVLNKSLSQAVVEVENTIHTIEASPCNVPEVNDALIKQLTDIQYSMQALSEVANDDLTQLKKNLSTFTISMFGRTMVGKSTLMEILTDGNGDSIGSGAQRTTRDVRRYYWKQMRIIDVPGIAAVDGENDEDVAWNAAKTADMIAFVVTDDGVQPIEAEWLGKVLSLGKPVICIVNVKQAVSEADSTRLSVKKIEKRFDINRLEDIKKQFLAYASAHGQDWNGLQFAFVHLRSAYLSQKTENKEKSVALRNASRIDSLYNLIMNQVKWHGELYREKTFIDAITVPICNAEEILLNQGHLNSTQARTIGRKKQDLSRWTLRFEKNCHHRINTLITQIRDELRTEISEFAEQHVNDKSVDKAWKEYINGLALNERCSDLISMFIAECDNEISEITRAINFELTYTPIDLPSSKIQGMNIIDTRKIFRWATIIGGGGFTIAAGVAQLAGAVIAGPLGWAALAVGVVGGISELIFKSRETKEKEARARLTKILESNAEEICKSYQKNLEKNTDTIVRKKLTTLEKEILSIESGVQHLGLTQTDLAWKLNESVLNLNQRLISSVLILLNRPDVEPLVVEAGRVPGSCISLVLEDRTEFPEDVRRSMTRMMNERIGFVFETSNKRVMVSRILGKSIPRDHIHYNNKTGVIHIQKHEITPELVNKIKIAQQLTQVTIVE